MASHGVVWVIELKERIKSVTEKIDKLGATKVRPYQVDYLPYKPPKGQYGIQPISVMHHTHFPKSTFTLVTPVDKEARIIHCTSDRGFDLIIGKLKNALTPNQAHAFQVRGWEYEYNDFYLRLGSAAMCNQMKGTILEIEYRPTNSLATCLNILIQFVNELMNDGCRRYPKFAKTKRHSCCTPADTMVQYMELFNAMRRFTGSKF